MSASVGIDGWAPGRVTEIADAFIAKSMASGRDLPLLINLCAWSSQKELRQEVSSKENADALFFRTAGLERSTNLTDHTNLSVS